jgi:hypothetical protein
MSFTHRNLTILNMIALFTMGAIITPKAHAFGDYQSHEHPFQYVGSEYSQGNGNAICRQIYSEMGGYQTSGGVSWSWLNGGDGGFSVEANLIYSSDGTVINGANHVWYHQQNGECIANK